MGRPRQWTIDRAMAGVGVGMIDPGRYFAMVLTLSSIVGAILVVVGLVLAWRSRERVDVPEGGPRWSRTRSRARATARLVAVVLIIGGLILAASPALNGAPDALLPAASPAPSGPAEAVSG
ncbi:MAG TPA: hypothetical protein VD763_08135 [Candidatus Saccharimonadales bacterium]|nr:hypothetical protein [Candidatus Saccharimonadales bacterium]